MDIGLLRTFLQVAKFGGIRKAAEKLFLTPSAISARIRQLEEEFATPLFERGKHGTHLTAAGERLRYQAEELLSVWNRLSRSVALPEGAEAVLAIGATDSVWQTMLLEILPQVRHEHPALAIRAESAPADHLLQGLLDGELDVVLLFDPPHIGGVESQRLIDLPLTLVSSRPGRMVGDLTAGDFIQVEWGSAFDLAQASVLGRPLGGMLRTTVGSLALQWLLGQGGEAILPEMMVRPGLERGELFPVAGAGSASVPIHLVRSVRGMDADAAAAIDQLMHLFRNSVL